MNYTVYLLRESGQQLEAIPLLTPEVPAQLRYCMVFLSFCCEIPGHNFNQVKQVHLKLFPIHHKQIFLNSILQLLNNRFK
jgi:hypothetical protein